MPSPLLRGVQLQSTSAGQEIVATDSRLAPQECAHYHPAPSSIAGNPKGRGPSVETIRTHARLFWHCMNQAARTLILHVRSTSLISSRTTKRHWKQQRRQLHSRQVVRSKRLSVLKVTAALEAKTEAIMVKLAAEDYPRRPIL